MASHGALSDAALWSTSEKQTLLGTSAGSDAPPSLSLPRDPFTERACVRRKTATYGIGTFKLCFCKSRGLCALMLGALRCRNPETRRPSLS